jgi:hypothetical protein
MPRSFRLAAVALSLVLCACAERAFVCPSSIRVTAEPASFRATDTPGQGARVVIVPEGPGGKPLTSDFLVLALVTGNGAFDLLPIDEGEGGSYTALVASAEAGRARVEATDVTCVVTGAAELLVLPGTADRIEATASDPRTGSPANQSLIRAYVADRFGNLLAPADTDLLFSTSLGTLGPAAEDPSGVSSVTLTSDDLGAAAVRIRDRTSGLETEVTVSFPAAHLGCRPQPPITSLGEAGTLFSLPLTLTPPRGAGLEAYDLTVRFDPYNLQFDRVSDPDPGDAFGVPEAEVSKTSGVRLRYEAAAPAPPRDGRSVAAAQLWFRAIGGGRERLELSGSVRDDRRREIADLEEAQPCTLLKQEKPENRLCVHVVVQKDAFADLDTAKREVAADIRKTQAIFDALVGKCCPKITLAFDPDADLEEREWTQQGNKAPAGLIEIVLAESQTGGWTEKKGDLACINFFYFKNLPDITVGSTTQAAETDCNGADIRANRERLDRVDQLMGRLAPDDPPQWAQRLRDLAEDFRKHPAMAIDAAARGDNTAAHELGHLLGLEHGEPPDNLMHKINLGGKDLDDRQCACLTEGKEEYERGDFPYEKEDEEGGGNGGS